MQTSFQCPHCQAKNAWPDYCVGKQVTCPGCQQKFRATAPRIEADAIPVEPVVDVVPWVVPVEEPTLYEEPPPANQRNKTGTSLDCVQAILDRCERRDLQHLEPGRRLVYALLVSALEKLRPDLAGTILTLLIIPFMVLFALGLGFFLMWAISQAARVLESLGLQSAHGLLYFLPAFVILMAVVTKRSAKTEPITLGCDDRGKAERFQLGRLDGVFRLAAPATGLLFFGILFSSQVGLLFFLPDHLGIAKEGTFLECLMLTLDNLCQGVLLDTFEMYDIHLGGKVEHTIWTASVFYAYRLGYEGLLLLAGFQLWRHYSMRRLFRHLPRHWRSVDFVVTWIDQASRTEPEWAREFLDEFFFLILAGAYLARNDDLLRDIDRRFPWLRIQNEVRKLFVDAYGDQLLEYQPEAT